MCPRFRVKELCSQYAGLKQVAASGTGSLKIYVRYDLTSHTTIICEGFAQLHHVRITCCSCIVVGGDKDTEVRHKIDVSNVQSSKLQVIVLCYWCRSNARGAPLQRCHSTARTPSSALQASVQQQKA